MGVMVIISVTFLLPIVGLDYSDEEFCENSVLLNRYLDRWPMPIQW